MNNKFNAVDFYLAHPLLTDLLLIIISVISNLTLPTIFVIRFDLSTQTNILSSLIGTSVSLVGFILAALTIIVAFKSNIACKSTVEAKNPLEFLFSTRHYSRIVHVFKDAIIELSVVFVGLYMLWLILGSLSPYIIMYSNTYAALLIILSLFRSLFVLFLVFKLEESS